MKVTVEESALAWAEGTGCLRYLSSVPVENKLYYYFMSTQGRMDRTSCDRVWYLDERLT